jgi:hypothetical protein
MVANTKSNYKITNWKDYNESLVRRGDITFWFPQAGDWRDGQAVPSHLL